MLSDLMFKGLFFQGIIFFLVTFQNEKAYTLSNGRSHHKQDDGCNGKRLFEDEQIHDITQS
ncbi:hypothetical protein AS196_00505 [Bacillus sp. TH007]|nr:hypothetical protein AS196_00505 [Bacillus sp. TH007]